MAAVFKTAGDGLNSAPVGSNPTASANHLLQHVTNT